MTYYLSTIFTFFDLIKVLNLHIHWCKNAKNTSDKINDQFQEWFFEVQYFGYKPTTTNCMVYLIVQKRYDHDCEFAGQMGSFIVRVQIVCQSKIRIFVTTFKSRNLIPQLTHTVHSKSTSFSYNVSMSVCIKSNTSKCFIQT